MIVIGWIPIAINGVAAYLFYRIDLSSLMIISIVNGIICFWSFYVIRKYTINRENMETDMGRLGEDAEEQHLRWLKNVSDLFR